MNARSASRIVKGKRALQRDTRAATLLAPSGSERALEQHAERLADGARNTLRVEAGRVVADTPGRPAPALQQFAATHGFDLGRVRIHADEAAASMADALHARAFTVGHDIYFGRSEYRPHTLGGRELLAHELTHAVQQSFTHVGQRVQCACRPPRQPFDLEHSEVGQAIASAVAGVTRSVPGPDPDVPPRQVPLLNSADVIALLASSPCFLLDAAAVESTYCPPDSRCAPRLAFRFHHEPTLGSEFEPGNPATLRVEVAALHETIQHIVHEIGHATPAARRGTWPAPVRRGWGSGGGAVTQQVRTRMQEESNARSRENEVMAEIQASPVWRRLVGAMRMPVQPTGPQGVRDSFVSGTPRLTYQEYFIVDAMKARYRNALRGITEERTRQAAQRLLQETPLEPTVANIRQFTTSLQTVAGHRERLRRTAAAPAPSYAATANCIEIYNRHRRDLAHARADLTQEDRRCPAFIELFRRSLDPPFSVRDERGRERVRGMRARMIEIYELDQSARRASSAVVDWYDEWLRSLGRSDRNNGTLQTSVLRYFSWVLIAESMAREWQPYRSVDRAVQRRHLQLLIAAGGAGGRGRLTGVRGLLTGTTLPPAGGTP